MSITIHLDECDPSGKGWERYTYGMALAKGGTLCEDTQYMTEELYEDESVWVEESANPQWVEVLEDAKRLERQALILRSRSNGLRCSERESGGSRCTRDALPADHRHAIDDEWMDRS